MALPFDKSANEEISNLNESPEPLERYDRGDDLTKMRNRFNREVDTINRLQQQISSPRQVMPYVTNKEVYFYIRQENSDMPDDGEDFPPTVFVNQVFEIYAYYVHASAGTYSVQLKIGGSTIGPIITQASAESITLFTTNANYNFEDDGEITLHVNSSSNCEEFECIFLMQPRS